MRSAGLGNCPPAALAGRVSADHVVSSTAMAEWMIARPAKKRTENAIGSSKERAYCLTALGQFASKANEQVRVKVLRQLRKEGADRSWPSSVRSAAIVGLGELARAGGGAADRAALA